MAFPFVFGIEGGETAVDINVMVGRDAGTWTWLQSSRSRPVRLEPDSWPVGLAKSVDVRNQARNGQTKGRVLVVRHGPVGDHRLLLPVGVLCWHVHPGNWPLTVLDMGCVLGLDSALVDLVGREYLLAALADLNRRPELRDREVPRPDTLGWAIRRQDGAGSDPDWGRAVATRAQSEWGFQVVRPRSSRPSWARDGFYGERQ